MDTTDIHQGCIGPERSIFIFELIVQAFFARVDYYYGRNDAYHLPPGIA